MSHTSITLYRSSTTPLVGSVSGASFNWPGTALTANTDKLFCSKTTKTLAYAEWRLAWNPRVTNPASPTGIRLIHFSDGPADITQFARVDSPNAVTITPIGSSVDVTASLNALLAAGVDRHIGHQTYGNGVEGCLIYASWLVLVWNP